MAGMAVVLILGLSEIRILQQAPQGCDLKDVAQVSPYIFFRNHVYIYIHMYVYIYTHIIYLCDYYYLCWMTDICRSWFLLVTVVIVPNSAPNPRVIFAGRVHLGWTFPRRTSACGRTSWLGIAAWPSSPPAGWPWKINPMAKMDETSSPNKWMGFIREKSHRIDESRSCPPMSGHL